jgi:hypothetical protein
MSSKSAAAKAIKRYRKNLREIDNYSWPLAVYEFGLYALPFASDFWRPTRGIPGDCGICKKKMTDADSPQSLIACGHDFCGECIEKWFSKSGLPQCPTCSAYIDREDDPDFCHGCNYIGCCCVYDELCPICHEVHEDINACIAEYYEEVNSLFYNPASGMLETIEEDDEAAIKKEEDTLKDACLVS